MPATKKTKLTAEGAAFIKKLKSVASKHGYKFVAKVDPERTHVGLLIRDEIIRPALPKKSEGPRSIPVVEARAPLVLWNGKRGQNQIWEQVRKEILPLER